MITIQLNTENKIEIDQYRNHTYSRFTKGGVPIFVIGRRLVTQDRWDIIGHYGSVNLALKKYIELEALSPEATLTLLEYANRIEHAFSRIKDMSFTEVTNA